MPIELVVSIGTGYTQSESRLQSIGWDTLVTQLIASSTNTEDVHTLLQDFLLPSQYYRFNPVLNNILRIDEKNKTLLLELKNLARTNIKEIETSSENHHFQKLISTLKGNKKWF